MAAGDGLIVVPEELPSCSYWFPGRPLVCKTQHTPFDFRAGQKVQLAGGDGKS